MQVTVNGETAEVARRCLADALQDLGYGGMKVAVAVNMQFIPADQHGGHDLSEGDQIDVVAPMKGG